MIAAPPRTLIPLSMVARRASGESLPSSISDHAASAVIIFEIDPIWKRCSGPTGMARATSARPDVT